MGDAEVSTDPEKQEVIDAFRQADADGDGTMSKDEFYNLMSTLDPCNWSKPKLDVLFRDADVDRNGKVDLDEFINWIFGVKRPDARRSSVRSSRPRRNSRSGASIEPLAPASIVTVEDLYHALTNERQNRLCVDFLVSNFGKARSAGLTTKIAEFSPGVIPNEHPEDISVVEVMHLLALIHEKPDATEQDAVQVVHDVKDVCRDSKATPADVGLDPQLVITPKVFQRLLELTAFAMGLDLDQLVHHMAYVDMGVFELTTPMADQVAQKLFLKEPGKDGSALSEDIDKSDLVYLSKVMKGTDAKVSNDKLCALYADIVKQLPNLLEVRKQRSRKISSRTRSDSPGRGRTGSKPRPASRERSVSVGPRRSSHGEISMGSRLSEPAPEERVRRIKGRQHLSVLMEELYKLVPVGTYASPLDLTVNLLQAAKDVPPPPRTPGKQAKAIVKTRF